MKIMLANRLRLTLTTGALALGLIALGAFGFAQQPATQPAQNNFQANPANNSPNNQANSPTKETTKYPAKGIEDEEVPIGNLPIHAVIRIEEGKLILRRRVTYMEPVTRTQGNQYVSNYEYRSQLMVSLFNDTSEMAVFDMKGNRLPPKTWKEKLKVDTHALVAFDGKLPNPRELTLFKDDTLILVLPLHSNPAVIPPPVVNPEIHPLPVMPQPNYNQIPTQQPQAPAPSIQLGPPPVPSTNPTVPQY